MPRRRPSPPVPEVPPPIQDLAPIAVARKFTVEQVRAQVALVERLLASFVPTAQIEAELRIRHDVKRARAISLIARVRARWAEEDADKRDAWKAAQIRSIDRSLQQLEGLIGQHLNAADDVRRRHAEALAKGEPPPKSKPRDPPMSLYREKREYLELRAEITGTIAPAQVEVKHTVQVAAAVQLAIASLTGDEAANFLQQMNEMEQLAAEAKRAGLLTQGEAQ